MALKLYVVGEGSPRPADWSPWSEYMLVLAETADEVRRLTDCGRGEIVTQVDVSEATVLCSVPSCEAAWGDDL